MKISAIIPCFNEGMRVVEVISVVLQVKNIQEVIVVDDGSDEKTRTILEKQSGIRLIRHKSNLGKAKALESGVLAAKGKAVFFIDADLRGLSVGALKGMINKFKEGDCDMLLGVREREVYHMKCIGFALAYTGERVIKKDILLKNLEIFTSSGYLVEPMINKVIFGKYKVDAFLLKGVGQVNKMFKTGLIGLWEDMKMILGYISFLSMKEFEYQLRFARRLRKGTV